MQEDVRLDQAGKVVLPPGLKAGANVRPVGEDIAEGHAALPAGRRLRPQDIALIAAFGLTRVEVRRRLRVAVFSTGNEVVSPGAPRAAAQLFDSNRFMLTALLKRLGCEVSDLGILRDDRASLAAAPRAHTGVAAARRRRSWLFLLAHLSHALVVGVRFSRSLFCSARIPHFLSFFFTYISSA